MLITNTLISILINIVKIEIKNNNYYYFSSSLVCKKYGKILRRKE